MEIDDLRIQRTSTADQIASALRRRILRGQPPPGAQVREVEVARSLGVSRNTLREGLRILVSEGLLKHTPHKGVTVTALSATDVTDIYIVREIVETWTVANTDFENNPLLDSMLETISRLEDAARDNDHEQIVELDLLFHRQIVDVLGSERISSFYANTLAELRLGLFLQDVADESWRDWVAHHREIHEALAVGQRNESIRLVKEHLAEGHERLLRVLTQVGTMGER